MVTRRSCDHTPEKDGEPVRFEMTEQTREAVDSYIGAAIKKPGDFLFGSRRGRDRPIATRQYARLVCQWIASVGLDRASLAHTHCAEPRRHSSTAALATCGLKLVPAEPLIKGPDSTSVSDSQALCHGRFGSSYEGQLLVRDLRLTPNSESYRDEMATAACCSLHFGGSNS
jgi:hypothetical protein